MNPESSGCGFAVPVGSMLIIRKTLPTRWRTHACCPMPDKSSKEFSQPREGWEIAVFREATMFTVVAFLGRPKAGPPAYDRQEFRPDQFHEALQAFKAPTKTGRPRLLYAVTAEGRQVCLDKADHDRWLAIWKGYQQ